MYVEWLIDKWEKILWVCCSIEGEL